jgi:hypothetical protein
MLYPVSKPVLPGRGQAFGYINDKGDIAIPLSYSGAEHFFEGKAAVLDSAGRSGFIDRHGNLLIKCRFAGLSRFHGGVCSINGGYLGHSGDWLIEPRYLVASPFSEGLAFVTVDGELFGYIDHTARFVVAPEFQVCRHFSEGLAAVRVDDRWGYIDRQGRLALPTAFEGAYATGFRNGMAGVRLDGKCGFIDRTGRFVIGPKYDELGPFAEGVARVQSQGKWGWIDEEGAQVLECRYEELGQLEGGIAPAKLDGRAGFVSQDGSWFVEPRFESSYKFFGDLAIVRNGITYSYISKRGEIVWTSEPYALTKLPPAPLFV